MSGPHLRMSHSLNLDVLLLQKIYFRRFPLCIFQHSPQMWQQYPQLVPGLLVIDGITPNVDVETRLAPLYQRARSQLQEQTESQMPSVAAWRRAYSQMGLKPT